MISVSLYTAQFPEYSHTWILRDLCTYLSTTTPHKGICFSTKKKLHHTLIFKLLADQNLTSFLCFEGGLQH